MLDFNTEPFFNDFDENNKFYSILFRPSVAVQARELNQLQTILQNQIKQQGNYTFKNGQVVIPGNFSIKSGSASANYVKLSSIGNVTDITLLIGKTIQNASGLEAVVLHASTITDEYGIIGLLYLSYTNSATDTVTNVFSNSDILSTTDSVYTNIIVTSTAATGFGSIASVDRGVYFINGHFVLCDSQTIILSKYTKTPTYRIGFVVTESIITSEDAGYESLLDNAQGSPNYAAPGAHRYYIDLTLTALAIGSDDANFIELNRVISGNTVDVSNAKSQLEVMLARRTSDESGDYTISKFSTDVREHRNNDRGAWTSGKSFIVNDIVTNNGYKYVAIASISAGGVAPTHTSGIVGSWQQITTPYYNRGIYSPDAVSGTVGDSTKIVVSFEPGKAYVQGYEIEKRSISYVTVDKPRDTLFDNNASVPTSVGSYVQVMNVHKLPDISGGTIASIYDSIVTTAGTANGNVIGTCRVRGVQYESGSGTSAYCKMFVYDVKMNSGKDFARDAKSFYYATTTFTANVTPDTYSKSVGIATWGTNPTSLVGVGTKWLTGSVDQTLKTGDWVYFGGYKAQISGSITDTSVSITGITATANSTGAAIVRIQTQISEPTLTSLVFPLPHYATQSVADHSYYIIQLATNTSVSSNTLNISVPSGTLLPDTSNYYVQDANGDTIVPNSVSATGNTAALLFGSVPTTGYIVYCTVNKTGVGSRKIKTLTSTSKTFYTTGSTNPVNVNTLTLDNTDCYKIVNIMMGSSDISDWYSFDNGQRGAYYDYGTLTLKPSYPVPTANITVNYQYFAHTFGDFFDLHSYTASIDQSLIPTFNDVNLRDVIDFRPRIDSFVLNMPKRGYNMSVDLTYYLARQDKIALDINGNFFDIKGSSSVTPAVPDDVPNGMTMCTLLLAPYTYNTGDVTVSSVDNKRYTMRDIGRLEKRIDNLEYYTSLSLLEQETSNLSVTDSYGLDRFKRGFIVDNFTGHNIGDVTSPDYVCSIDMENGELRPFTSMDNINLLFDDVNSTNVLLYGDMITLPLDSTIPHVELAQNVYASRTEYVNPFAVFTFIGDVKMNPSADEWFEVDRRPDIVQNVEGNFNTIAALAEKAGVLGTVWNAWQTQWTGSSFVTGSQTVGGYIQVGQLTFNNFNSQFGNAAARDTIAAQLSTGQGPSVGARFVTLQTSATLVGQSRTGVKSSIVSKVDTQVVDDKIISTAVIPYIRSRNILIQTKGLKPNTRFYPFFDNVAISDYCTPATAIIYTPTGADDTAKIVSHNKFDTTTNSGISAATDTTRRINGDTQVCLNTGDVITGSSSGAKAVIVGKERAVSNAGVITYKLYVMNVSGTFTTNDTLTGSISGATGVFVSSTVPTTFVSGASGDLNLLFNIPNKDDIRFRTGSREFKLLDVNDVSSNAFTSRGRANYVASGILQTKQATVIATRNAQIVEETVYDNQVITQSSSRVVQDTGWYDPLAQTFMVDSNGGALLSKVDLYFAAKDNNIPVTIEIREVVNGYPGKTVLPFSRITIKPENINLSSTNVTTFDNVTYPKYDTATTITFPTPVYVKDKTEYALVVMSDSNKYKVWISQMGDIIPDSSGSISEQPYAGVLFKSQNASTWSPYQDQDLKFTIWRANFNTSLNGIAVLTNDLVSKVALSNPFQTLAGSNLVKVLHKNHGFKSGDSVTFSGATSTDTNIIASKLNATFIISSITLDTYVISIAGGTTAAATGYIGGNSVLATRNIRFDTLQPNINVQSFPDTIVSYTTQTTEYSTGVLNSAVSCIANDNNYFTSSKVVPNGSTGKLNVRVALNTTNAALSPIIDTLGTSAIAVVNKIDSPTESSNNVANIDNVTLYTDATTTITATTLATSTTANQLLLKRIIPGSYIAITSTSPANSNVKCLITSVNSTNGTLTFIPSTTLTTGSPTSTTVVYYNSFFDEITPVKSSTTSKYVSKVIKLASVDNNSSKMLRIRFATCCPSEASVLVYYKTGMNGTDFSKVNWTLVNPDKTMPKTSIGSNTFYDVDYTLDNLPTFDNVTVKLVMKSTNTVAVPRIKDLRIIACA